MPENENEPESLPNTAATIWIGHTPINETVALPSVALVGWWNADDILDADTIE